RLRRSEPKRPSGRVSGRISHARFGEALLAQQARIAAPASQLSLRVVAGVRDRVVDAERDPGADDLGLAHLNERRVDLPLRAFGARARAEVGHVLEGGEEL